MYHHSCSVQQKRTDFSSTDWELHFTEGRELTLQYYTPCINHRTRQNPGPDKYFLPKGKTGYRRCFFGSNTFIYEDCKSAASLSKSNNQHALHLTPLGQFCNQKKSCCKAFSWAKIQWLLCLLGFVLLFASVSAEALLLLRQAHRHHYLSLQALLFYFHRPV